MIRPSQTDNSLINQLVGSSSTNTTHSLLQVGYCATYRNIIKIMN